jgi:putative transposase
MQARMQTRLVLDALTMAVWRSKPKNRLIIYSDQGSQFGTDEFSRRCKDHRLSPRMSRRGNCWDNAVAESFFSSQKSELIKKKIYPSRSVARSEIFEYIEELYDRRKSLWDNRVRRYKNLAQLSPMAFEQRQIAL